MFRNEWWRQTHGVVTSTWWILFLEGLCLVLLGLLVLLVPEILVFLVAMPIVFAGCAMIAVAIRIRRHRRTVREVLDDFPFFLFGGKHRW